MTLTQRKVRRRRTPYETGSRLRSVQVRIAGEQIYPQHWVVVVQERHADVEGVGEGKYAHACDRIEARADGQRHLLQGEQVWGQSRATEPKPLQSQDQALMLLRFAAVICASLAMCACATSIYHGRGEGGESGYTDTRISEERWRVEYSGDSMDTREAVERFMLRRAAELTLQNDFNWFLLEQPELSEDVEIVVVARDSGEERSLWSPTWIRHSALRGTDLLPYGRDAPTAAPEPYAYDVTRYSAVAEIVMGRGAPPSGAFVADAVNRAPQ